MSNAQINSTIVNEVNQGNSKAVYFFFTKKFWAKKTRHTLKPSNKKKLRKQKTTKATIFSAQELLRGWKSFVLSFGAFGEFFRKTKINSLETVLITSFTILLTCTPINPPIEGLFVRTYFDLWSSLRISFFMRIFLNPSYLWESLYLWSSVRMYLFKTLWK